MTGASEYFDLEFRVNKNSNKPTSSNPYSSGKSSILTSYSVNHTVILVNIGEINALDREFRPLWISAEKI